MPNSIATNRNLQYKVWGISLFIIYPLFSLPFIFRGIIKREKWAYLLASIFMGYMGILYPPAGDMYRYAQDFNLYKELDWNLFWIFMALRFDYFLPLLSFFLGKLGLHAEITRFIFVTCSYFMLFNLYHDITFCNKELSKKKIRILALVILIPLTFNGYLFRMGFAQITLMYGIYWLMIRHKNKGYLFIILASIIHWSFTPFILITIISKIRILNFSNRTFIVLCCLLIFADSVPIGIYLIQSLPIPESLFSHINEYISGSQAGEIQFSIKQIVVNQFANIVFYITLYAYYIYYKNNPQPLRLKQFTNSLIIIVILSSSIPELYGRMLGLLKSFLVLSFIIYYKHTYYKLLRIVFLFIFINLLFSFWQLRFYIRFGQYDQLLKSTSIGLITFHYTDDWITRNVDEDGILIKWLKLGYRPAERE